jgi:hypothetical protein
VSRAGIQIQDPLSQRVRAALRRQRSTTGTTLARGLGAKPTSVCRWLAQGVTEGWARVVRKEGPAPVYEYVEQKETADARV